ncbi:MAG: hypothetical protein PEGG_00728 [Paraeggerthella hongkongensis]
MNNKRCEITIALYGDTSDNSSLPGASPLPFPQYFVGAYAMRDACCEEDGWHFPLTLRFEKIGILVCSETEGGIIRVCKCDADTLESISEK